MSRKNRVRKLTVDERLLIVRLCRDGEMTQKRIAELFGISQARVSQLRRNYYGELPDDE